MDIKFNSLFDNVEDGKYYSIHNRDNLLKLSRVVNQNLILNYNKEDIESQQKYEENNFSDAQSIILSGRSCSTSPCNNFKRYCCSSGRPTIINKVNNFKPVYNSNKVDQNLYAKNINFESNLKNIDYQKLDCKKNKNIYESKNICVEQEFKFFEPTKRINPFQ